MKSRDREDTEKAKSKVREGLAAIERGEYTDYLGREGLDKLVASVKTRGRKRLAERQTNK
jgi:hypothetical protein